MNDLENLENQTVHLQAAPGDDTLCIGLRDPVYLLGVISETVPVGAGAVFPL